MAASTECAFVIKPMSVRLILSSFSQLQKDSIYVPSLKDNGNNKAAHPVPNYSAFATPKGILCKLRRCAILFTAKSLIAALFQMLSLLLLEILNKKVNFRSIVTQEKVPITEKVRLFKRSMK